MIQYIITTFAFFMRQKRILHIFKKSNKGYCHQLTWIGSSVINKARQTHFSFSDVRWSRKRYATPFFNRRHTDYYKHVVTSIHVRECDMPQTVLLNFMTSSEIFLFRYIISYMSLRIHIWQTWSTPYNYFKNKYLNKTIQTQLFLKIQLPNFVHFLSRVGPSRDFWFTCLRS